MCVCSVAFHYLTSLPGFIFMRLVLKISDVLECSLHSVFSKECCIWYAVLICQWAYLIICLIITSIPSSTDCSYFCYLGWSCISCSN